jgi:hypothetical protein
MTRKRFAERQGMFCTFFKYLFVSAVLFIMFALPYSTHSIELHPSGKTARSVNKQFIYYIYWTGIRAGKAVLHYQSTPEGISIKTHATSSAFISLFYKVDDMAQSILYPDGYPKKFTLKVRQGRHKRDKATYFGKSADGKTQKIVFHNIRDEDIFEYYFDTPAYDPLSAFHEMTKRDLSVGKSYYIDIFDNEKLWNTEVQVLRKEKVRVPAGEYDTLVVKPILQSEGIFPKTGEITIWATDDDRKLPVLMKSKARIGYFKAVLAETDH